MAIAYKEEALPKVATFPFDITHWKGVNKIKANRYDQEMADCRNMSVDNYPYASSRKPRKKVVDEQGVKRIYKVDGSTVYYIDKDDCLCHFSNGKKEYIIYTENEVDNKIVFPSCQCTNNYDDKTVFYPEITYLDENNKKCSAEYKFNFGDYIGPYELKTVSGSYVYYMKMSASLYVENPKATKFRIKFVLPENEEDSYLNPSSSGFDKIQVEIVSGSETKYISRKNDVNERITTWNVTFNEFKENEEIKFVVKYSSNKVLDNIPQAYWKSVFKFIKSGEWVVEQIDNGGNPFVKSLDYGTVYNNRIVGVSGNDIRVSALGDFTNFWEFADEAGNPSATGAYATDVGSAGDFTGICVYNNMVMLFKKNLVYEMYGSMPYNISELCTTGCIDNDSICEIDGVLYWASPKGIVRYSGGVPTVISYEIDIDTSGMCKAGTDGRKYYVYDGKKIFVYDTLYRVWHIEDEKEVRMFYGESNELYMVSNDGIYKLNCGEENVEWEFETKDFTFNSEERKNLSKLWIRAEMSRQSRLEVYVRQNSGEWTRSAVKTAEKDEMFDFKLRIKKCDSFALKFKGVGDVRILDVHGKVTVGTSKHRSGASLNVYR